MFVKKYYFKFSIEKNDDAIKNADDLKNNI